MTQHGGTSDRRDSAITSPAAQPSMRLTIETTPSKGDAGYTIAWDMPVDFDVLIQKFGPQVDRWDEYFYNRLFPGGRSRHRNAAAS